MPPFCQAVPIVLPIAQHCAVRETLVTDEWEPLVLGGMVTVTLHLTSVAAPVLLQFPVPGSLVPQVTAKQPLIMTQCSVLHVVGVLCNIAP